MLKYNIQYITLQSMSLSNNAISDNFHTELTPTFTRKARAVIFAVTQLVKRMLLTHYSVYRQWKRSGSRERALSLLYTVT
jgi:hypothetical protein